MDGYGREFTGRMRHWHEGAGHRRGWRGDISDRDPTDEGYDRDYGYRGGIGLGSRWARRGGNLGWSSGGRRIGGWERDQMQHAHPDAGPGRMYSRGPLGFDRGFHPADSGYAGHERNVWHRDSFGPRRTHMPYDAPYRSSGFGGGYGRDYHSGYAEDFGDRVRRGWGRVRSRAREFFEGDEW